MERLENLNFKKHNIPNVDGILLEELIKELENIESCYEKIGKDYTLGELFEEKKRGTKNVLLARKKVVETFGNYNAKASKNRVSDTEIMGLYVFSKKNSINIKPEYVGISRKVVQRLRNHLFGKSSDQATFAYLLANSDKVLKEDFNNNDLKVRGHYCTMLRDFNVFIYPYNKCSYKLQLLEVLLSCRLKTYWNSFETH